MRTRGYNSTTSWAAAFACSVLGFLIPIPMRIAGLLYIIIIERYQTSRMYATIPIMVFGIIRSLTGPFIGYLGLLFGTRNVTLVGCLLASTGIAACFFAEDIIAVTIFLGFIFGFGYGLGNTLIPEILKQHFSENLNLVNGMFLTGACLGGLIMPPVVQAFIDSYGDSGMFLLLGGIMLHSVPFALLLVNPKNKEYHARLQSLGKKEVKDSMGKIHPEESVAFIPENGVAEKSGAEKNVSINYKLANEKDDSIDSELLFKPSGKKDITMDKVQIVKTTKRNYNDLNSDTKSQDLHKIQTSCSVDDLNNERSNPAQSEEVSNFNRKYSLPNQDSYKKSALEINNDIENCEIQISTKEHKTSTNGKSGTRHKLVLLFLDPTFLVTMTIQSSHAFITTLNRTVFIDYSRDKGVSPSDSLYFLMFLPVSEIAGSLCLNWISDRGFMTRTKYCVTCHLIISAAAIYTVWASTYTLLMVGILIFGLLSGSLGATFPGMIHEFIEEDLQGLALASRFVLYAFLCLTKSPITGFFRGTLGSYDWVYFIIAICSTICGILAMFTPILANRTRNKKRKRDIALKFKS